MLVRSPPTLLFEQVTTFTTESQEGSSRKQSEILLPEQEKQPEDYLPWDERRRKK